MHINMQNLNQIVSVSMGLPPLFDDSMGTRQALVLAVRDLVEDGYSETAAYAKTYNDPSFYD
ncbi:MAG: hypothetical protein HQL33_06775 [Alphaproteobacteria bacterium]|nr:hypothetical protein [Alphaproteobacteria bacterium]MBF0129678.1 hypothetical protein [Alphaproteobacteria bacterium]